MLTGLNSARYLKFSAIAELKMAEGMTYRMQKCQLLRQFKF